MNVRQLIAEVKQRPPLWNKKHELRCERTLMEALWDEVAIIMGQPLRVVKVKWKTLKDAFRKEAKKVYNDSSYEPHWTYYKLLIFLFDQLGLDNPHPPENLNDQNSSSSLADQTKIEFVYEDVTSIMKSDLSLDNHNDGISRVKSEHLDSNGLDLNDATHRSELYFDDEDMCFFKSLVPHVKQLSPQKKMLMRIKIQEMIYKEVYAADLE